MTKTTTSQTHSIERPPVIVIMGHIDHGKSTLLDYIRKSNIVAVNGISTCGHGFIISLKKAAGESSFPQRFQSLKAASKTFPCCFTAELTKVVKY